MQIPPDAMPRQKIRPLAAIRAAVHGLFDHHIVAHDLAHLARVELHAMRISRAEGGDPFVIRASALLHDMHRLLEHQEGAYVSPSRAEYAVRTILDDAGGIDAGTADHICACVRFTEMYRCAGDDLADARPSVEARVVRDADMLDALGAVGIARAFMFGARMDEPLWLDTGADAGCVAPFRHGKSASIVHHFHEKLLRLHDEMLTEEGRCLARARTAMMHRYLRALATELDDPAIAPAPAGRRAWPAVAPSLPGHEAAALGRTQALPGGLTPSRG